MYILNNIIQTNTGRFRGALEYGIAYIQLMSNTKNSSQTPGKYRCMRSLRQDQLQVNIIFVTTTISASSLEQV